MARQQRVLETVTCDVCGKVVDAASTVVLGWGNEQWELDLCDADNALIGKTFDSWIEGGRKIRASNSTGSKIARSSDKRPTPRLSDWDYLESLGFKRHRGRKTVAEQQALGGRPS